MKILIATILIIMGLHTLLLIVREWIDGKKAQREQDEIKENY